MRILVFLLLVAGFAAAALAFSTPEALRPSVHSTRAATPTAAADRTSVQSAEAGRPRRRRHVSAATLAAAAARSSHVCICGEHRPATEPSYWDSLNWLVSHQSPDGRWSASDFEEQCGVARCGGAVTGVDDAETTGLALLSLLGGGETHRSGAYKEHVRRALDFLCDRMSSNGWMASDGDVRVHAIATLALVELYGLTGSKSVRPAAERALAALLGARDDDGGRGRARSSGEPARDAWSATRGGRTPDLAATVWAAFAVKSAAMSELPLPPETRERVVRGLREFGPPIERGPREAAALCVARTFHEQARPRDIPELRAASDRTLESPPAVALDGAAPDESLDVRTLYFELLVAFQSSEEQWPTWQSSVRATLAERKCTAGPAGRRASLNAWGPSARAEGRVRRTALASLTLSACNRYHRVFKTPR